MSKNTRVAKQHIFILFCVILAQGVLRKKKFSRYKTKRTAKIMKLQNYQNASLNSFDFSFIGGFAAGLGVALIKREKAGAKFVKIELFIFAFWLVLACFLALNFSWISANLAQIFSA